MKNLIITIYLVKCNCNVYSNIEPEQVGVGAA